MFASSRRPHHAPQVLSHSDVLRALGVPEYAINQPSPPSSDGIEWGQSSGVFPCTCEQCVLSENPHLLVEVPSDDEADVEYDHTEDVALGASAARKSNDGARARGPSSFGTVMVEKDRKAGVTEGAQQPGKLKCPTCGLSGSDKLQFCSVCRKVAYCSRKCQVDDWKSHKPICKKLREGDKGKGKAKETDQVSPSASDQSANKNIVTKDDDDEITSSIVGMMSRLSLYECACCGWDKDHDLKFCDTCKKVKYCSDDCKATDRKTHQPVCDYIKEAKDRLQAKAAAAPLRRVYVPEKAMNKCSHCQSRKGRGWNKWKVCKCGEVWFCSPDCAKESWKTHKAACGNTDQLDIQTFYPFLAFLVERSHMHELKPPHVAFTRTVVNPGTLELHSGRFDDGWEAVPVFLAPSTSTRRNRPLDQTWWPKANDDTVRARLAERIQREGFVLPIITSILVTLLSEMYTTTSAADSDARRVRLRYRSEPITDFGICAGSARVTNQDKLAYIDKLGSITHGQDPKDHYWMYFLTARGEEILLDCAMFTFNMNVMLFSTPYIPLRFAGAPVSPLVPAFFQEREIRNNTPGLYTERTRLSVLRDPQLQKVAENSGRGFTTKDEEHVVAFMEKLSRRRATQVERELTMGLLNDHSMTLREVLEDEEYKEFPSEPRDVRIALLQGEPGEFDDFEDRSNAWWNFIQQEKRKNKKRGNAWPVPPL